MARSRRKQPITGFAVAESEKKDKQSAHRKYRRRVRVILQQEPVADSIPQVRELSDPWSMAKDGKVRFNPVKRPKLMRK